MQQQLYPIEQFIANNKQLSSDVQLDEKNAPVLWEYNTFWKELPELPELHLQGHRD